MNNKNIPTLRFLGFKEEWQLFKLKDIVEIKSGKSPLKENSFDIKNEIYQFPIISGGTKITNYYKEYNCYENTITISRSGAAGYVSFQRKKFYLTSYCLSLKIINEKKILVDYLYFYLKSKQKKLYLLQQGTSIPNLDIENLKNIKIYVPVNESSLSLSLSLDFLNNVRSLLF